MSCSPKNGWPSFRFVDTTAQSYSRVTLLGTCRNPGLVHICINHSEYKASSYRLQDIRRGIRSWFNKGRSYTTQVAVIDGEGRKRYKKRVKYVERPRFEWVAVPVHLGEATPASPELVEAAREAIKDNSVPSTAGHRFWELSGGGILRCKLCGGADGSPLLP